VTATPKTLRFTPHTLNENTVIIVKPILVENIHIKAFSHPRADIGTLTGGCNGGYNVYLLQHFHEFLKKSL
jgi:hypothetical protein